MTNPPASSLTRRTLLRNGTILGTGLGGAALASCSHPGNLPAVREPGTDNAYVQAPPLSREYRPPAPLDLRGEGRFVLPMAAGAALYYWDTGGAGVPIVLVHAGTGSADVWGYQQGALVAAGYRVIAYSRRGHRGSDTGPLDVNGDAQPGSGRPLDDIEALVTHLGLTRFHLLGHAAGGGICNGYVKVHPERVLSLISVAALQGIAEPDWEQPMSSIRAPGGASVAGSFSANPAEFREVGPSYRWANPEGLAAWLALEHDNRPVSVNHPAGISISWADIAARAFPTLLIGGDADLFVPPAMYRYLHSRVPNSELYIIPEAGHSVYWEQPEVFNRVLLDFLGRQRG